MKVVGCFLEYEDRFVILLRQSHKPDGNTWGLPSGKVEVGENHSQAVRRELLEETGIRVAPSELQHIGDYNFVSSIGKPYTYATYKARLNSPQQVTLETAAHAEYRWVTAEECYAMPNLISGFHELLILTGYFRQTPS